MSAFGSEAFEAITNADRSFIGSLRLLITRPGVLTAEYMRGRRVGLMKPLQLFLLVNVVYFLYATATNNQMFATNLANHMNNTWHSRLASRMVLDRLGDGKVESVVFYQRLDAYRQKFDRAAVTQAKTLIAIMIPGFALCVALLQWRRRRYLVEHLVFSIHTYAAFLILGPATLLAMGIPVLLQFLVTGTSSIGEIPDPVIGLAFSAILIWYLRRALMTVYGDGKWAATAGAMALTASLVFVLMCYRTVLFLITFAMT